MITRFPQLPKSSSGSVKSIEFSDVRFSPDPRDHISESHLPNSLIALMRLSTHFLLQIAEKSTKSPLQKMCIWYRYRYLDIVNHLPAICKGSVHCGKSQPISCPVTCSNSAVAFAHESTCHTYWIDIHRSMMVVDNLLHMLGDLQRWLK